jgi:hypothetical protein
MRNIALGDGRVRTVYDTVEDAEHPEWGTHRRAVVFAPPAGDGKSAPGG